MNKLKIVIAQYHCSFTKKEKWKTKKRKFERQKKKKKQHNVIGSIIAKKRSNLNIILNIIYMVTPRSTSFDLGARVPKEA